MDYEKFMDLALAEAKKAKNHGEIPVGAIIVRDGEIISTAFNETEKHNSPLFHAELLALQRASEALKRKELSDCTIFVTMEPCPMCAAGILLFKTGTVVFGVFDERTGAFGSKVSLSDVEYYKKIKILGGIKEKECKELLREFFEKRRG